ncbi:rRNA-processing protein [Acrasis kona]|uniref:rRNA-processing protein n=1 Tax=Acrasis kona TaxID=1008807 RepID=A0AAW2Z202_9EUKA
MDELKLRQIQDDILAAKSRDKDNVAKNYEEVEDEFPDILVRDKVSTHNLLLAQEGAQDDDDDDDIELDAAELQAYMNLQKANSLIDRMDNPDQPTISAAHLRYNDVIMNEEEINNAKDEIALSIHLPWVHTLNLTSSKNLEVKNIEDDMERELAFYEQALLTAKEACHRLKELGIPTVRPDDYFAEMVKTDDHMLKVKDKMLYSKKLLEDRESRRRLREQKKLGKQMQITRIKEKLEEKKASLDAVKYWRKTHGGKGKEFDLDKIEDEIKNNNAVKQNNKSGKSFDKGGSKKGGPSGGARGNNKGSGAKKGGAGIQKNETW